MIRLSTLRNRKKQNIAGITTATGLVIAIPVEDGTQVSQGDVLVILESMKMQNELKSPQDGVISRIRVAPGDSVDPKQIILTVS